MILRTPGIGPVKYAELLNKFGCPAAAAESLATAPEHIDLVKREIEHAARLDIHYICSDSEFYPANLKLVKNHPPVLTVRGRVEALRKPTIGIVGTRHATGAGMRFVHELAHEFALCGFSVASGMAMGTDTAAHMGALASKNDSCTIAVLAGGADYIWPLENEKLYHQILERGAVISEMPVGTKAIANNFIQRNRWIAGISERLILGEADGKSGSMATAGFAIDYGRPVHAIPGHPSDSRSMGPNRLIKEGRATLCAGIGDFFETKETKSENRTSNSDLQDLIGTIPMTESVLAELVKKNVAVVRRELVMLELGGQVRKTDSGYVKV